MGGVDTVRGINYQHCHAVLVALDIISDPGLSAIRVEGTEDVMDLEVHAAADGDTVVVKALQMKSRLAPYTWGKSELLNILGRWVRLGVASDAKFEFVTNAALGRTGAAVVAALDAAHEGNLAPIAELLDISERDPVARMMSRVRVRNEAGGVEALLLEAEREVRSSLPGGRNEANARVEARAAVDRLFRLLSLRAGHPADTDRLVSREELTNTVGDFAGLAAADRWPSALASEYVASTIAVNVPAVRPALSNVLDYPESAGPDASTVEVVNLLDMPGPVLLNGRTGSGKSTAADLLRQDGSAAGVPVVICHAEAYIPGRLDALAADAIGAWVGRDLPRAVGRQALNDANTIIVIDGVSEVPSGARRELAEEVRPHVAANAGAHIILLGRDSAATSTLLPVGTTATRFAVSAFGQSEQVLLARQVLFPETAALGTALNDASEETERDIDRECAVAVAQVKDALGDAVGNPLLLTLGLRLVEAGASFRDRSTLYGLTIDRMSERANTADIRLATGVLGIVFARLLDEGRRYANPLEWERLVAEATKALTAVGIDFDPANTKDTLIKSGIVNAVVSGIGRTELRGPVHDSFADYLAGRAHADGIATLPATFTAVDEQRLLFTAEMGTLPHETYLSVARTLPFTLVRMSSYDHRPVNGTAPDQVHQLLAALLPAEADHHIIMWRQGPNTLAQVTADGTRWLDERDPRLSPPSLAASPMIVCDPGDGPSTVVVRLWRAVLRDRLRVPAYLRPPRAVTLEMAQEQLQAHAAATRDAYRDLLAVTAPPQASDSLADAVGPIGMTATITPTEDRERLFAPWSVAYTGTDDITISIEERHLIVQPPHSSAGDSWTHLHRTHLDAINMRSPRATAANRIRDAINSLTRPHWL